MGCEPRPQALCLVALIGITTVGDAMAETRDESIVLPDTTTAVAGAPVGLGELRLFFAADERLAMGSGFGAVRSSGEAADAVNAVNPALSDMAIDRSEETGARRKADPDADGQTSRPRRASPVTPPLDFQAILRSGQRVQLLFGGQLCRTSVPQLDALSERDVHCSPLPSGARSLAFDARSGELVIETRSGRWHRLAVGESWTP